MNIFRNRILELFKNPFSLHLFHWQDQRIFRQIFLCQLLRNKTLHIDSITDQNSLRLLVHRFWKLYNKSAGHNLYRMFQ